MQTERPNLAGMTAAKLRDFFSAMGERPFRADQVMKWIHQRGVTDFAVMTDIGKSLRDRLAAEAEIRLPVASPLGDSADGSRKWTVRAGGASLVETVFIPEAERGTLCISSQAGCALDCAFCATGKQGFDKNLTAAEIIGQVWQAKRALGGFQRQQDPSRRRLSNVVLMGMGEPLLNFDAVMDAVDIMLDDRAYGLSKRRVTISTAGVVPAIRALIGRCDASLAISLHAPNDELRSELMPINRRYPIGELLAATRAYMASLADRRVPVIEYILIKGVNDHRQHARELARILADLPCKINLIPFNSFDLSDFARSSPAAVGNFRGILRQAGYTVTVRTTRADDIAAACGQLVGAVADRTRRSYRRGRAIAVAERF